MMTFACCYVLWMVTYMAQLHPMTCEHVILLLSESNVLTYYPCSTSAPSEAQAVVVRYESLTYFFHSLKQSQFCRNSYLRQISLYSMHTPNVHIKLTSKSLEMQAII